MSAIALPLTTQNNTPEAITPDPKPIDQETPTEGELISSESTLIPMGLLAHGSILNSPGNSFQYEIIGPICRLYDLDQLPYPCCRLQWKGKEPSWNREGRRFVPDMATRKHASYHVKLVGGKNALTDGTLEITLYWKSPLSREIAHWWTRNREAINSLAQTGR
jgi:hypothetical protein